MYTATMKYKLGLEDIRPGLEEHKRPGYYLNPYTARVAYGSVIIFLKYRL